ncbi:glycosyltransferase family protein [Teichococcus aestuarii]|uniref:glycosyltransferase family 4 protein n=1 Tax=Teichococcus aestuarii TaxID=568898 RepID=UPI0011B246F4|nr:glycosyltransferase family 4 protein [Pseudoroseomonas aestuarii]
MRVLVVSPIPSHPADQGNSARIQAFGHQLKQRGSVVDFFYYGMEGLSNEQRVHMSAFWNHFHFMPSLPLARPCFAECWGLDDWCPTELVEAVSALHRAERYDAVIVNYVWMSRILTGIEGAVRVLDTHDLFGDRHRVSEQNGLEPRWFFTSPAEEDRGFARADVVIGIQDEEAAIIRGRFGGTTLTVGHPMTPYFLTDTIDPDPLLSFGYLGSANPWNLRSVAALDAALGPDAGMTWALAGTILRRNLSLVSNPVRLGVLPTVDLFYQKVRCVLNPMLGGTGLKIKTVEALAYGRATIGTRDAFIGLPVRHTAHRLETVSEIVDAMREYMGNPAFRKELLNASWTLYLQYLAKVGWEYDGLLRCCAGDLPRRCKSMRQEEAPWRGAVGHQVDG